MSTKTFRSVFWVAGVGAAALGCYMLSLQVASERADLAGVERRIVAAQQEIRSLQTELGTRGRLQQLEHWNAEVLALSAPASGQYLENDVVLASFETRSETLPGSDTVRLASAEIGAAAAPATPAQTAEPRATVRTAVAEAPAAPAQPVVRRASLATGPAPAPAAARPAAPRPAASTARTPAPARASAALLDERTTRAIGETARAETRPSTAAPSRTSPARTERRPASATPARPPARD